MVKLSDLYILSESSEPPDWDDPEVLFGRLRARFDLKRDGYYLCVDAYAPVFGINPDLAQLYRRSFKLDVWDAMVEIDVWNAMVEIDVLSVMKILNGKETIDQIVARWKKEDRPWR